MKYLIVLSCLLIFYIVGLKAENNKRYVSYEGEKQQAEGNPQIYDLKEAPKLFEKFVKEYNKKYENDEDYNKHYKHFVSNLEYINQVNSQGRSYSTDINQFADNDDSELEFYFGGVEGDE